MARGGRSPVGVSATGPVLATVGVVFVVGGMAPVPRNLDATTSSAPDSKLGSVSTMNVCVFCGANPGASLLHVSTAQDLGKGLAENRFVRGHGKVPGSGQVEVLAGGQEKVPTLRSSCWPEA